MSPSDIAKIAAKYGVSKDVVRRNLGGVYFGADYVGPVDPETLKFRLEAEKAEATAKRLRQRAKPLLNKLEREYFGRLVLLYPGVKIHAQAWRVKIANGGWYKVDLCASINGRWTAWECKEFKGKNAARGIQALKVAAFQYPEIDWFICWKVKGEWHQQRVLP